MGTSDSEGRNPEGAGLHQWLETRGLDASLFDEATLARPWAEAFGSKEKDLALALYVELASRITTQALPYHSGQEAAALTSLYSLFDFTRKAMTEHGAEGGRIGLVALSMLNDHVRPVTAYWHGASSAGRLQPPDWGGDFRGDLRELQNTLRGFMNFFGTVAFGSAYTIDSPVPELQCIAPKGATRTLQDDSSWTSKDSELKDIEQRRKEFAVAGKPNQLIGVAISGGGIRSATFSIGVLQALSDVGLYRFFDYVSTVSGGGYTGALLSSWARPSEDKALLKKGPFYGPATQKEPDVVRFVRDRTRFFLEGSGLHLLAAGARAFFGALGAVATVMALVLMGSAVAAAGAWLVKGLQPALVVVVALTATGAWAWTRWSSGLRGEKHWWWSIPATAMLVVAAGAAVVHIGSVGVSLATDRLGPANGLGASAAAAIAAVPAAMTLLSKLLKYKARLLTVATLLLRASPWVAFVSATAICHRLLTLSEHPHEYAAASFLLACLVSLLTDVNRQSWRTHYQSRLARVFCVRRDGDGGVESEDAPIPLGSLSVFAPVHLINATVNLPSSHKRDLRDRRSAPIVFSKNGWSHPKANNNSIEMSQAGTGDSAQPQAPASVDLATAMAISGAAVSSFMGTMTLGGSTPWLTLFNLRLGYWARNPGKGWAPPSGYYLLKEFLGRANEENLRLNLTDGGHYENLGLYELMRRRCRYIIAIDGEADSDFRFGGLIKLMRMARIDFGAQIRIDLRRVVPDENGQSSTHFALGEIRYKDGTLGRILYLKLSVTGDEPRYVTAYREQEPAFPHQSTADQFFDEAQFEAYRALGEHVGQELFTRELVGVEMAKHAERLRNGEAEPPGGDHIDLAAWFEQLEESLMWRARFGDPR